MIRSRWFPLTLLIHLLTECRASFLRAPDNVDFFYDPLMPRVNDTLVLEVNDLMSDSTTLSVKPRDHRWYYRELGSSPDAFRRIGVGRFIEYNITDKYQDGYFMLIVTYCCDLSNQVYTRKSVKLIRIQRPLTIEVFLNGYLLPGNLSVSSLAAPQPNVNIECRISGMPTSFQVRPPLGVACNVHRTFNEMRYVSVVRRGCTFSPGTYKCSARNDLSRVTVMHFVEVVVPRKNKYKIRKTTRPPNREHSPTPFVTKDKDIEEISSSDDRPNSYSENSEKYERYPTKVVTVNKEKSPKYPAVKPVGTKRNTAQRNSCSATIAVATLTWFVSMRQ